MSTKRAPQDQAVVAIRKEGNELEAQEGICLFLWSSRHESLPLEETSWRWCHDHPGGAAFPDVGNSPFLYVLQQHLPTLSLLYMKSRAMGLLVSLMPRLTEESLLNDECTAKSTLRSGAFGASQPGGSRWTEPKPEAANPQARAGLVPARQQRAQALLSTRLRKFLLSSWHRTCSKCSKLYLSFLTSPWQQRHGGEGTCGTAMERVDPAGCGHAEGIPFWNWLLGFGFSQVSPVIGNRLQTPGTAFLQEGHEGLVAIWIRS